MSQEKYRALLVEEYRPGHFIRTVQEKSIDDLPEGDTLIRVHYSSLNYKDALSASGNKGVTRNYPHTPGIDAAGVVEESSETDLKAGDEVVVQGYDLGMNTPGGFGEYIRIPHEWAIKKPDGLTLRDCMGYGTAGFTAGLCVYRLSAYNHDLTQGEVVVTGASGGVGSFAVAMLSKMGAHVAAVTGKESAKEFLEQLGASEIIDRNVFVDRSNKALLKGRWSAGVDTVGGSFLSTVIRSTRPGGSVACCGNAASPELSLTVYPFILRGVSLLGIDSANCSMNMRKIIWEHLSTDWKVDEIDRIVSECTLEELGKEIDLILKGGQTGRKIVNLIEEL